MPWYWNTASNRYHHRDGTEYFMSRDEVLGYVQQSINAAGSATDQLAGLVTNGQLAPGDWNDLMRQEIKDEYIRQYLLGRGGREQMTAADWGSIGGSLRDQYRYLDGFYENVVTGELTEAQIAARARMYVNSAREAFNRGQARAYGLVLPQYPGDGQTVCLTNCGCDWRIEEVYDGDDLVGYDCYWEINPAIENCVDCQDNNRKWYPLFVPV